MDEREWQQDILKQLQELQKIANTCAWALVFIAINVAYLAYLAWRASP